MNARVRKKIWPRKNLGELLNFIEEQHPGGASLQDIADKLNVQRGAVSNLFRKDDMFLSKAEEIVHKYGYELKLYYPVRKIIEGLEPKPSKLHFEKAGNLSGLVRYIQDGNLSVPFTANQINQTPKTLYRAFYKGDIKISTLNAILDKFGICVIWKFNKI